MYAEPAMHLSRYAHKAALDRLAGKPQVQDTVTAPIVFIVDRDPLVHESLVQPARELGWDLRVFDSVEAFLQSPSMLSPSCLVLGLEVPGLDLVELQERIAIDRPGMPIVLVTGTSGCPTTLQANPAGAVWLINGSFDGALLAQRIASALKRSQPALGLWERMRDLRNRLLSLSRREHEVMSLVVRGLLNKQVAGRLGISEITVKVHRANIMHKMHAASLASLVTMAARLGLEVPGEEMH